MPICDSFVLTQATFTKLFRESDHAKRENRKTKKSRRNRILNHTLHVSQPDKQTELCCYSADVPLLASMNLGGVLSTMNQKLEILFNFPHVFFFNQSLRLVNSEAVQSKRMKSILQRGKSVMSCSNDFIENM